jgi:hypothetical protein
MPLRTGLNLNLNNVRLPDIGIKSGTMGIPTPTFGVGQTHGTGIPSPSFGGNGIGDVSTMPFMPSTAKENTDQQESGLVIQRNESGDVDWLSTLARAGALGAVAYGAAKGNTTLASAGAGYLKGEATGLQQKSQRQEREQVRAEAQAEREAAKTEQATNRAINDVESAIARKDWEVAEQAIGRLPADQQEAYRATIASSKTRAEEETATKKSEAENKRIETLYLSAIGGSAEEMRAVADAIRLTNPEKAADLDERAKKKIETEGDFTDRLFATYANDIKGENRSSQDLGITRAEIVQDTRLSPEQKDILLGSVDVKVPTIQREENVRQGQNALRVGDYKAAAKAYQAAGIDTNATRLQLTQLDRHKEYRDMLDRAIVDSQKIVNGVPVSHTDAELAQIKQSVIKRVEALTGYPFDPMVPDSAFEERSGDKGATGNQLKTAWIKGSIDTLSKGTETLDEVLSDVDESVGQIEFIPNDETALVFKTAFLDSVIANPSVPSNVKKEARKKQILLLPDMN